MPAGNSPAVVTLPSDLEIRMVRTFNAPRRLVWEACTKVEHVKNWWGRRGSTLSVCEIDLRVGGAWRFVTREADGSEYGFRGEIREIEAPRRLVQTFEFEGLPGKISIDTMELVEQDGKTVLTSTSRFSSKEDRDGMLQSGMAEGANETYDRLEELLRRLV